jgi:hypothetical protein
MHSLIDTAVVLSDTKKRTRYSIDSIVFVELTQGTHTCDTLSGKDDEDDS